MGLFDGSGAALAAQYTGSRRWIWRRCEFGKAADIRAIHVRVCTSKFQFSWMRGAFRASLSVKKCVHAGATARGGASGGSVEAGRYYSKNCLIRWRFSLSVGDGTGVERLPRKASELLCGGLAELCGGDSQDRRNRCAGQPCIFPIVMGVDTPVIWASLIFFLDFIRRWDL